MIKDYSNRRAAALTNGVNTVVQDPLHDNYISFMVAIYKECIDDLVYGANKYDQATAKAFLKSNPYGLQCDFDYIIEKKKEEIKKCK